MKNHLTNHLALEEDIGKKYLKKDRIKTPKMKVNSKSVFSLKKIIIHKNKKTQKQKNKWPSATT